MPEKHSTPGVFERFGRYTLMEPLAKGGMAQIYKAITPNGKIFTLKKILQDYSDNPEFIKMFLEEAKISLNLKHPNIVRVLDFGQVDGSYFLAMEYVFGRDIGTLLRTSVEKRIHVPIEVACTIIWHAAKALAYAHTFVDSFGKQSPIIHRDISPPNILVSYNGDSKVLDFGIAKATKSQSRQNTRSGVLKGKFSYMSPEQALGEPLTPQSDLFSLGIVFWELLTSRSLFYSQDEMETLERVRKADVESPRKHRKDIPSSLERIVMTALRRRTKDRYASCADFADAIRVFLKNEYPRTDARAVAKFVRACFPEDFQKRSRQSLREGWVDILVSGAEDDELLLDHSIDGMITPRPTATHEERLSLFQRLVYDPRLHPKFLKMAVGGVAIGIVLVIGFFAYRSGQFKTLTWFHTQPEKSISPSAQIETPKTSISPSGPGYAHWIQKADEAEAAGDLSKTEQYLTEAQEINPLDASLQLRLQFLRLAMGNGEKACQALSQVQGISEADRLLSDAICLEFRGDLQRALASYLSFATHYPEDLRNSKIKLVVESIRRNSSIRP